MDRKHTDLHGAPNVDHVRSAEDVERLIERARYQHVTNEELMGFDEGILRDVTRSRLEAHLEVCALCEQRLALIRAFLDGAELSLGGEELSTLESATLPRRSSSFDVLSEQLDELVKDAPIPLGSTVAAPVQIFLRTEPREQHPEVSLEAEDSIANISHAAVQEGAHSHPSDSSSHPSSSSTTTSDKRDCVIDGALDLRASASTQAPSGSIASVADRVWRSVAAALGLGGNWTFSTVEHAFAGGEFATSAEPTRVPRHEVGEWLRVAMPVEAGELVAYVEATGPASLYLVVYGVDATAAAPETVRVDLEQRDVTDTRFAWGQRTVLGSNETLRKRLGEYHIMVVVAGGGKHVA